MSEPAPHHHYFQMVTGGMACACGEVIKAGPPDLPAFLRATDLAMKLEGIGPAARERVISRLVYGDPAGARAAGRNAPVKAEVTVMQSEVVGLGPYHAVVSQHAARAMRAAGMEWQ